MLKCILIDDEPLALAVLEDDLKKIPFVEVAGKFTNPFQALHYLQQHPIDLVFVDIQMPDISGVQLVKSLPVKPMVIFSTAFSEFAIEGFDLDAVDYLLKPFSFDRLLKAVNKASEWMKIRNHSGLPDSPETEKNDEPVEKNYFFIKSDYMDIKVNVDEILYIEADKDYVKIFCNKQDKPFVTQINLKHIEEKLPMHKFYRIHRSYIIALEKITSIQKSRVIVGKEMIPIGDTYREDFLKKFGKAE